jgi:hypothetical protein
MKQGLNTMNQPFYKVMEMHTYFVQKINIVIHAPNHFSYKMIQISLLNYIKKFE